jgi:hypothetical protein
MRVKILSMQRVVNYGSFMQAYAMKRVLESFGNEVSFCDFKPGTPRHLGEKVKKSTLLERLSRLPQRLMNPRQTMEKRQFRRDLDNCFAQRVWPLLGMDTELDYDSRCDLMVIGSDEVFNYTQNHVFGYVPAFFGHGLESKSIISYAASAGYASLKDVENDGMGPELAAGFKKFDALGVRDQNTYDIVARYAERQPTYVVDPTFLYDFDAEVPAPTHAPGFVLVYAYEGRLDAPPDVKKIKEFAASKGLTVVSAGFYHEWCDEHVIVTPFELLALFRQASYVITDTFHGTIFSIKNRKPFVSLLRGEHRSGGNSNKLGFLLHQVGLSERINTDLSQVGAHLETPIDYDTVHRKLAELRQSSMDFLASAMGQQPLLQEENKVCQ